MSAKGKSEENRTMRAKGPSPLVGFGCKHSWAKYWDKF